MNLADLIMFKLFKVQSMKKAGNEGGKEDDGQKTRRTNSRSSGSASDTTVKTSKNNQNPMPQNFQGSEETRSLKSQNPEYPAAKIKYESPNGPCPANTNKLSEENEEIPSSKHEELQTKRDSLFSRNLEKKGATFTIKIELPAEIPGAASRTSLSPYSSHYMSPLSPIKTLQTVIDSVGDEELGNFLWKDIFRPLSVVELLQHRRQEAEKKEV